MKTKALAEGAILAAMSAVLGLASIYLPIIGTVTAFLWPLPIVVLVMRHGMSAGVWGMVAVGVLLAFWAGPLNALLTLIGLAGVGLWFGFCFRRNLSPLLAVGLGTAIAALSVALRFLVMMQIGGVPMAELISQMGTMLDSLLDAYQKSGMLDKMLGGLTLTQYKAQMLKLMEMILPAAFAASAMLMAFVAYLLAGVVLRRLGYQPRRLPAFSTWRLPWPYLWGLIIAIACIIAARYTDNEIFTKVAVNIIYIYAPILTLCGLSVVVFWWHSVGKSPIRFLPLLALLLFPQYAVYSLLMLGLWDSVFPLRKLFVPGKKE